MNGAELGTGDAEGDSRAPGACLYTPYLPGGFPTAEAVAASVKDFPQRAGASASVVTVTPGLVVLRVIEPQPRVARLHHTSDRAQTRGLITSFSPRSRLGLSRKLASLDYAPWMQLLDAGWLLGMLTLTYPNAWEHLAPTGSSAYAHLKALRGRFERATSTPLFAAWKREFQRRSAPHFHLIACVPFKIHSEPVQSWVSRAWYEVVGSGDPRHLAAGTGIDWTRAALSTTPARVARYFSAHSAPGGRSKEYQQIAPALWIDAGDVGRYWGIWGLKPAEAMVGLTRADAILLRRVLRRIDRSRRRTTRVAVRRVRIATGEVYERHVRRRRCVRALRSGRLTGGSVYTVDGPALAHALARYLSTTPTAVQSAPLGKEQ